MGSAASLQGQLATTSAEELRKVFEDLPEAERQKLLLAMTPGTGWTAGYGVCGRFASKDFETTKKLVLADAEIQVKEEAGAPWFTVLGKPSTNVDPPDTVKDKAFRGGSVSEQRGLPYGARQSSKQQGLYRRTYGDLCDWQPHGRYGWQLPRQHVLHGKARGKSLRHHVRATEHLQC